MKLTFIFLVISSFVKAQCLQADIVLLADYSRSIHQYEKFVFLTVFNFAGRLEVDDNGVRIGIMFFGENTTPVSRLTGSRDSLLSSVLPFENFESEGSTIMSKAVIQAGSWLKEDRPGATKMLIIITDGAPDNPTITTREVDKLKERDVMIITIFIDSGVYRPTAVKLLKELATSEDLAYTVDYHSLIDQLQKLEICI